MTRPQRHERRPAVLPAQECAMFRTTCAAIVLSLTAIAPIDARQRYTPFDSAEIKVQYPDNWNQAVLSAGLRVAFIDGHERSFAVSRTQVNFSPKYNEAFAEVQENLVREEFPRATQLSRSTVAHTVHGQILQIDLTIPGVARRNPRPLHVRYVAIPVGTFIYRVTCIAREDEFKTKYDAIFRQMVDRLVVTPPAS
jgi:hypothetical protein